MSAAGAETARTEALTRSVFISYSRKDGSETADRLRDILTATGCDVWLDTDRIPGGASWSRVIEDALNNCHVLITVSSEESGPLALPSFRSSWSLFPATF